MFFDSPRRFCAFAQSALVKCSDNDRAGWKFRGDIKGFSSWAEPPLKANVALVLLQCAPSPHTSFYWRTSTNPSIIRHHTHEKNIMYVPIGEWPRIVWSVLVLRLYSATKPSFCYVLSPMLHYERACACVIDVTERPIKFEHGSDDTLHSWIQCPISGRKPPAVELLTRSLSAHALFTRGAVMSWQRFITRGDRRSR